MLFNQGSQKTPDNLSHRHCESNNLKQSGRNIRIASSFVSRSRNNVKETILYLKIKKYHLRFNH